MEADERLVEYYQQGEENAFTELVRRYQKPIFFLALKLVKNPDIADEITQRTFINVFQGISGFRKKSKFKTWLYKITINLCRNYFRRNKNNRSVSIEDAEPLPANNPDPIQTMRGKEISAFLRRTIDDLPEQQKRVLILKVYHDLTFLEAAEVLNLSVGGVKANFHQGIKKIKAAVLNNKDFFKEND